MGERFGYRDLSGLAKASIGLLLAQAAFAALAGLSDYWSYQLHGAMVVAIDEAAVATDQARAALVALLQMLIFIIGGICTLLWISHANRNAHAIGTLEMEAGPYWAVGWFFIPFVNLFMPFRVVREIWAASRTAVPGEAQPSAVLLGFWWLAWLATNIAGFIALRITFESDSPDALRTSAAFDLVSNLALVLASLLFAAIIVRVQDIQKRAAPIIDYNERGIRA